MELDIIYKGSNIWALELINSGSNETVLLELSEDQDYLIERAKMISDVSEQRISYHE